MTLEEAEAKGRQLGEHEADLLEARGSMLAHRDERIARAERYAIWLFNERRGVQA